MRPGVRVGVDVGSVRVGVARSDPSGLVATPVETVRRVPGTPGDVDRIAAIVAEEEAFEVVVGLPRTLRGEEGSAAEAARQYATAIAERVAPVPVRAVFIRAPEVEKAGANVQVLAAVPAPVAASSGGFGPFSPPEPDSVARIVAVRSGNLLATSFHPEVTGERRIHELFIQMIRGEA